MCKLLATVGGLLDASSKVVKNYAGTGKQLSTKVGLAGRLVAAAAAAARPTPVLLEPQPLPSHPPSKPPLSCPLMPPAVSPQDIMNVYFGRIALLAENEAALDSRHRFMLLDLIEQRRNRWRPRKEASPGLGLRRRCLLHAACCCTCLVLHLLLLIRSAALPTAAPTPLLRCPARLQAEGPKTIEEIHREEALKRSRSAALDRQQSGRGGYGDRDRGGPRGGPPER